MQTSNSNESHIKKFFLPYDIYERHRQVGSLIKNQESVLDIGGGLNQLAQFCNSSKLVVANLENSQEKSDIQIKKDELPFKQNSFDVVCAIDVLEHNPKKGREIFIKNLMRVAKDKVIISFPIGTKEFHKGRYSKSQLGKVIWYAGGKIDWQNILGIHIGVDEVDTGQFDTKREIDFATGACMLVQSKVFRKIGLLDDKYFLYLEDLDFSYRAKKAGFNILFAPKATLWHKNAASSGGSGSETQDYFMTRNRLLFATKYAKLRTKLAVFRQIALSRDKAKKRALIDFLTFNFGKGSYLK